MNNISNTSVKVSFLVAAIAVIGFFAFAPMSWSDQSSVGGASTAYAFGTSGDGGCCSSGGSSSGGSSSGGGGGGGTPVVKPTPSCTLVASPAAVVSGGNVTLNWTTKNADTTSLSGFGTVPNNNSSRIDRNVTQNTTYTLTVKGNGKTVTCKDTVKIKQAPAPAPTCTLNVTPAKVNSGDDVSITWTTNNATAATLSGFGSVSLDGSETDSNVTQNKTYKLTATGNGKTVTCSKAVTVKQPPVNNAPSCSLTASPSRIDRGDDVELSWSTENARSASLSAGFGSVSLNGSRTDKDVTRDTTYTLTVIGTNGQKITCTDDVELRDDRNDEDPWCDLYVDNYDYSDYGSRRVVLHWESDNARDGYINNGIGDVSQNGSRTIYVSRDTTFKGTFTDRDGDEATCSVKVNIDGYVPPTSAPYVYLSAVPYTGLDLGPVGTALYWSFLVLWCLAAAYLVAVKRAHMSVYRWYKKAIFGEEVAPQHSEEASFAGFSQSDLAKLAGMLRGTATHADAAAHAATEADGTDPFILSQIHRGKRS